MSVIHTVHPKIHVTLVLVTVIEIPIARAALSVVKETMVRSFQVSLVLKSLKAKEEKIKIKMETTAMILNGIRNSLITKKQRLTKSQKRSQKKSQRKKKTMKSQRNL